MSDDGYTVNLERDAAAGWRFGVVVSRFNEFITDFSLTVVGVTWFRVVQDTYTDFVLERPCPNYACKDKSRRITIWREPSTVSAEITTIVFNETRIDLKQYNRAVRAALTWTLEYSLAFISILLVHCRCL